LSRQPCAADLLGEDLLAKIKNIVRFGAASKEITRPLDQLVIFRFQLFDYACADG
jgi:hypothetical protein